jgi:hypothetical protein
MMYHDDDELDRALFALPLEPLPDGLRASILAAVSVVPVPILTGWEIGGIGAILALATWLTILVLTGGSSIGASIGLAGGEMARVASNWTTLAWLAVGVSTALWLSLVSVPRRLSAVREAARG